MSMPWKAAHAIALDGKPPPQPLQSDSQLIKLCSLSVCIVPLPSLAARCVARNHALSMDPVAEKLQQPPQCAWFFTLETAPRAVQFTASGASSISCCVSSSAGARLRASSSSGTDRLQPRYFSENSSRERSASAL